MLTITVQIDAPPGAAQGAKEVLAMAMERVGITRVIEVREDVPQQQTIAGWRPTASQAAPTPQPARSKPNSLYTPKLVGTLLELYRSGAMHDPEEQARLEAIYAGMKGQCRQ